MGDNTRIKAQASLLGAAEKIREALDVMNREGDFIDSAIATQTDGCPYGDVRKGLVELAEILWSHELGPMIVNDALSNGCTLANSALFFAERAKIVRDVSASMVTEIEP